MSKKKTGLQLQWEASIKNGSKMTLFMGKQLHEKLQKALNQKKDE